MERIWQAIRYLAVKFLEEKYKAFRAGVVAGGVVSLPFLLHVQGLPLDLIWLLPLKLLMCSCFSFCTGMASLGAKSTFSYLSKRWKIKKISKAKHKKPKDDEQAA